MPTWIFDLDYTLYQQKNNNFSYDRLYYSKELNRALKNLDGKKVLFTNGNLFHTLKCVKIMRLEKIFNKVLCRELTGFKPDINSYIKLYHLANVPLNEKCIFFEDTIDNLVQAKRFNWTTVLIGNFQNNIRERYSEIDYVFPNIIQALNYFN
tara:strand:- start:92 stop:547 length:456 start_codon:yes stop_codon:yes gene_type:complete